MFYSSVRHERSMQQGIILAYNNKYPEGGLSELKLTTEDGCVNNGFNENEARETEQHGDTAIVSPGCTICDCPRMLSTHEVRNHSNTC